MAVGLVESTYARAASHPPARVPGWPTAGYAGPLQMFAAANDELSQAYRIEIAAPQAGPFATSSGVRLVADVSFVQITNKRLARVNTLITVGGEPGMRQELVRGNATDIVASRLIQSDCRV